MSLMSEYINRSMSAADLEAELLRLIREYNSLRKTYLFVYAAAIDKPIPQVPLEQTDFYVIRDLLAGKKSKKFDMYLETPGGRAETAEEIVRYLHSNYDSIAFIVSGEAKSAGTIMALSGDEILMTETGSLGPIDAQMRIGRSVISAYDYIEWVNEKREEAAARGVLNPFDATMIAQISPGELGAVYHSLKYAEELVVEWLVKYKFKNWVQTETRKLPVTSEMRETTAKKIALELTNHSKWRSHGRSIKIDDIERIGLRIIRVDADEKLSNIVYRIQTVCRLLFDSTTIFKIFATQHDKIFRMGIPITTNIKTPTKETGGVPDVVEIMINCPKCERAYKFYAKLTPNPQIDVDYRKKKIPPIPKDSRLRCKCGVEIDLSGIKNQTEIQTGRKIIY